MIQELHIVVAEGVDGSIEVLYAGKEAGAAEYRFGIAGQEHAVVCLSSHVFPTRVRYPSQEVADAKHRAGEAVRRAEAAQQKKLSDADAAEAKANELIAQAKALRGEPAEPAAVAPAETDAAEQPRAARQPRAAKPK